jgi:hypothetical protein
MLLNYLCPPALLYAVIMLIYLILELSNKKYHQALVKTIVGIIFTCILQAFCEMNLGIVSWIFVMIPIIFYIYITLLTFFVFGLNPQNKNYYLNHQQYETPETSVKDKWIASNHKSSTPITSTLYTPSLIPAGASAPSNAPNSYIGKESQNFQKVKEVNYPGICEFVNISSCSTYSVCSLNSDISQCVPNYDYQNNINNLFKKCSALDKNKCMNDKKCYLFDDKCAPSIIGMADLLNKQDCINFNTIDYNRYVLSDTLHAKNNEEKDQLFLTKSFGEIDTKGCGYVSQNIMETLYATKQSMK